jgi:hypothetical protein
MCDCLWACSMYHIPYPVSLPTGTCAPTGADLASAASQDMPKAQMQQAGPPVVERYLQQAQQVLADTGLDINLSFDASSSAEVQAASGAGVT